MLRVPTLLRHPRPPRGRGARTIAYVLVDEEQFGKLLGAKAALDGVSYYVQMGDSVLLDGVGEVYTNPLAVALDAVAPGEDPFDVGSIEAPVCDCE
jgi:hypothetical protein